MVKKQIIGEKKGDASVSWKWHERRLSTSPNGIPQKSGVYVMGAVEYCRGLESSRKYIYVGRTNDLQRRFKEHGPVNEPKKGFRDYMQKHVHAIKYWYCLVPENKTKAEEEFLIQKFSPRFNDKLKPKGATHEQKK